MKNLRKGLIFSCFCLAIFCLFKCGIYNCLPPDCPIVPCDLDKFENVDLDSLGRYFKKGELVLTFPDSSDLIDSNGTTIDTNYIKEVIISAYLKEPNIPEYIDFPFDSIKIERCICDEKIFLIISDLIIGGETNVAEAANDHEEIRPEGGIFSLNYIVENDNGTIPNDIVNNPQEFNTDQEGLSFSSNKPIVAILDSGIDASKFPDVSGIYASITPNEPDCDFDDDDDEDTFGYNFIGEGSPNNNIQDFNGHGTVVSLAFKSRLVAYPDVYWDDQRLLTVRVLDECGNGTIFSTTCGLAYAKKKEANIINCSFGIYFNDIQLQRAISQIPSSTAIVCSAGNKGETLSGPYPTAVHFPSGYGFPYTLATLDTGLPVSGPIIDNVYEVSAIDHMFNYSCILSTMNTQLASYSNKRQNNFVEPASHVQYIIPGNPCPNEINGTSFAAPAVTARIVHFRKHPATSIVTPPDRNDARNASINISPTYKCFSRLICQ